MLERCLLHPKALLLLSKQLLQARHLLLLLDPLLLCTMWSFLLLLLLLLLLLPHGRARVCCCAPCRLQELWLGGLARPMLPLRRLRLLLCTLLQLSCTLFIFNDSVFAVLAPRIIPARAPLHNVLLLLLLLLLLQLVLRGLQVLLQVPHLLAQLHNSLSCRSDSQQQQQHRGNCSKTRAVPSPNLSCSPCAASMWIKGRRCPCTACASKACTGVSWTLTQVASAMSMHWE